MTQLFNTKKSLEECRANFKEAIGTGNIRGRIGRIKKGSYLKFRVSNFYDTRLRRMPLVRVACIGKIEEIPGGAKVSVKFRYGAPAWLLILLYLFSFLLLTQAETLKVAALIALICPAVVAIAMLFCALGGHGEEVKLELIQFLQYVLK